MRFTSFLAVAALAFVAFVATAGAATMTTVATRLDNPRGLAFLPNGTLTVGEAGHGGDVCIPGVCVGDSSQVSTIDLATGSHTPIVTGLFSLKLIAEGAVLGVSGLSTQGGRLLAIVGEFPQELSDVTCADQPSDCTQVLAHARATAGTLAKVTPSGNWLTIAGVGATDYQWTVDHQNQFPGSEEDSNPYGVLGLPSSTYVADAGSNLLDSVGANGSISVLYRFPDPVPALPFPTDAVPTCVALTPDGRLYVGDLAGRIWQMSNGGTSATLLLPSTSGQHFTGCESDAAGDVYFVSIFSGTPFPGPGSGSLWKLSPASVLTPVMTHLNFPNKVAVGFDGSLYVSVNTVCPATPGPCGPATGSVVRITP